MLLEWRCGVLLECDDDFICIETAYDLNSLISVSDIKRLY